MLQRYGHVVYIGWHSLKLLFRPHMSFRSSFLVLLTRLLSTVLKVGFNAGHSSLNWLMNSRPSVRVLAFDLGETEYMPHAVDFLQVRPLRGSLLQLWATARRYDLTIPSSLASLLPRWRM